MADFPNFSTPTPKMTTKLGRPDSLGSSGLTGGSAANDARKSQKALRDAHLQARRIAEYLNQYHPIEVQAVDGYIYTVEGKLFSKGTPPDEFFRVTPNADGTVKVSAGRLYQPTLAARVIDLCMVAFDVPQKTLTVTAAGDIIYCKITFTQEVANATSEFVDTTPSIDGVNQTNAKYLKLSTAEMVIESTAQVSTATVGYWEIATITKALATPVISQKHIGAINLPLNTFLVNYP